jgi:hypothetical protein
MLWSCRGRVLQEQVSEVEPGLNAETVAARGPIGRHDAPPLLIVAATAYPSSGRAGLAEWMR